VVPIYVVDAFTSEPFRGNPAAVCLLPEMREDAWMQQVANEMQLSETAFVVPDGNDFQLRWFTPTVEVDLCGHATLASAHVLWTSGALSLDTPARFHTASGLLIASRVGELIELDFPAEPVEPWPQAPDFSAILGAPVQQVGRNRMDGLVELDSEATIRALQPDLTALAAIPIRGLIVTSVATTPGVDFVSRFFGPRAGVNEDPVTGSAHCGLGPYWQPRLGKDQLVGLQVSARTGRVHVRMGKGRVYLGGQAVTVTRGELLA
jgi:PhzF family phenazine biosynthesis protein